MATVSLCPILNAVPSFILGVLNAGGLVSTFLAGSSTPAATYSDSGGTSLNANPIQILPNGYLPAELWLIAGTAYKIVVTDSASGNAMTFDNITAPFASGALSGISDFTTTGNTILGTTSGKTLNVANGALVVDGSGRVGVGVAPVVAFQVKAALNVDLAVFPSTVAVNGIQLDAVTDAGAAQIPLEFGASAWNWQSLGINRLTLSGTGVLADGLGNPYQPIARASKAAATSRNSTTTLADDPDLIVALGVGRWNVQCWIPIFSPASGAGGFKSQLAFSGTLGSSVVSYRGSVLGAAVSDSARIIGAVVESSATITSGNASNPDYVVYEGGVTVTVAGNLSFQWAQQSSNASFISVGTNAFLLCTKVG